MQAQIFDQCLLKNVDVKFMRDLAHLSVSSTVRGRGLLSGTIACAHNGLMQVMRTVLRHYKGRSARTIDWFYVRPRVSR